MISTKRQNMRKRKNLNLIQELRQLFTYLSRRRRYQLALTLLLMLLSSISEVVSLGAILPFLAALSNANTLLSNPNLKPLLTFFSIQTSASLVLFLTMLFISVSLLATAIRILTINVQTNLAASISSDLSCQIYTKTLLQPYNFHVKQNSSDLMSSVTEDTKQLTINILIPFISCISNGFIVLGLTLGLFLISSISALFVIFVLGGSLMVIYRLRRNLLSKNSRILVKSSQQQIKIVQESLGGIRDVLLGGTQSFFEFSYRNADIPYRQAIASNTIISLTPRYIVENIAMIAMALLALGLGKNGDFRLAVPVLGSLALAANRLLPALQQFFSSIIRIQGARSSLKRILIALQRSVDPLQTRKAHEPLFLERELRFENIWFRYSDDSDWILKNLNLTINAKTTVGFVGSTGSGKSTTADLILGLLKPQEGSILVDGNPLQGELLKKWQRGVAHVPQSIFLSDASITENIAFGINRSQIDFKRVCKAAKLAQISGFIESLPEKYETLVGERGVRLSGGQRQRIGIARALYSEASVIVFDEATSALDNATEEEVMEAIESLSHEFTIILIAHRLSTLKQCDRIIELSFGQIIFQGTHQERFHANQVF
jgi:ABC-type multidrug transport system fused ATPase/permease subunit